MLAHINSLAAQLLANENVAAASGGYSQRIPLPTEGHMMRWAGNMNCIFHDTAYSRVHQPVFPTLDPGLVSRIIEENQNQPPAVSSAATSSSHNYNKLVPLGQRLAGDSSLLLVTNTSRRLEVLRSCIANIFENKISDAKKTFPAVIRALKTTGARLALCEELGAHVVGNQVGILASDWLRYLILTPDWLLQTMLEHAQFDLVVRLMNAALQDDSDIDMHGVAAALLPLSCTFGRKLCPGVIQFVYTLIQVILASD